MHGPAPRARGERAQGIIVMPHLHSRSPRARGAGFYALHRGRGVKGSSPCGRARRLLLQANVASAMCCCSDAAGGSRSVVGLYPRQSGSGGHVRKGVEPWHRSRSMSSSVIPSQRRSTRRSRRKPLGCAPAATHSSRLLGTPVWTRRRSRRPCVGFGSTELEVSCRRSSRTSRCLAEFPQRVALELLGEDRYGGIRVVRSTSG